MGQNKTFEWHLLVGHRVEERAQFFEGEIAGEQPNQLLVFQMLDMQVVFLIVNVGRYTVHKRLQGQFTTIDFRIYMSVRI